MLVKLTLSKYTNKSFLLGKKRKICANIVKKFINLYNVAIKNP